jgi:hypothetical protein
MKNKFKMFFDKHGTALAYLAIFTLIFGSLFNLGAFDSILYVRRSPAVNTVTYKDDSSIRPIYVSWVSKDSDDTKKFAPKLKSLDTSIEDVWKFNSPLSAHSEFIATLTYGRVRTALGVFPKLGDRGYLYLYNEEANTYKGYRVAYFKLYSDKGDLVKKFKAKYGSAYDSLPWKYHAKRSMKVVHLKDGRVEVYLKERYYLENQDEVDKAYKDVPKEE